MGDMAAIQDTSYVWVRQSLYRILSTEMSQQGAKLHAWMLATAWVNADKETQDRVVSEIERDLERIHGGG